MAQFPATPQAFSFKGRELWGVTTSLGGKTPRRFAAHVFPKRDGDLKEDMGRGSRSLEVQLVFTGDDCAKRYQAFEADVSSDPIGQLVHPIAGQWTAFCTGPAFQVNYAEGVDRIAVPVAFLESQLDAKVPTDTPDVPTAAQNCAGQQAQFQTSVATFMCKLGKLQTQAAAVLNAIDSALAQVTAGLSSPVAFARAAVNTALGFSSNIVGQLAAIQAASDALVSDVTSFIDFGNQPFDGVTDTPAAGYTDAVAAQLGIVQADAVALEAALLAATATPAGCADAYSDVEVMVEYCMTLSDAIQASLPPTAKYTVVAATSLIALATKLVLDLNLSRLYDPSTYAAAVQGLNRVPNPHLIPGGTVLTIPTG